MDDDAKTVLRIASRQRLLIWAILCQLLVFLGPFAVALAATAAGAPIELSESGYGVVLTVLTAAYLVAAVVAFFAVIVLACEFYGSVFGVLIGMLTVVPLLGTLILLSVNQRATHALLRSEVAVGFMGAKRETLPLPG